MALQATRAGCYTWNIPVTVCLINIVLIIAVFYYYYILVIMIAYVDVYLIH